MPGPSGRSSQIYLGQQVRTLPLEPNVREDKMIDALELEWKISGLVPSKIENDCIYYNRHIDTNYSKRVFGSSQLGLHSTTLEPTKQFHQALHSELKKHFNLHIKSFPYSIPVEDFGEHPVKLKLRLIENKFLVVSIQLKCLKNSLSVSDTIKLQKISSHPILESIIRFCFNVHHSPEPSQTIVKGWQCKPLVKFTSTITPLDDSSLVGIVTRHENLDQRAITEMLEKNTSLNFNSDKLLIDKQGVVFLLASSDKESQRNRFNRISALYEYAVYIKAIEDIQAESNTELEKELQPYLERINTVLNAEVLLQSVSAKRGWELLKKEMNLKSFSLLTTELEHNEDKKTFYNSPTIKNVTAVVGLIGGVAAIIATIIKLSSETNVP
jgi:hypothetical protein